jgi:hypothetical protein
MAYFGAARAVTEGSVATISGVDFFLDFLGTSRKHEGINVTTALAYENALWPFWTRNDISFSEEELT